MHNLLPLTSVRLLIGRYSPYSSCTSFLCRLTRSALFIKVHFYLPSEEAMYSAEYGNYFNNCYTPNSEEDMDFGSQTSPPKVQSSPQQRKKTLKRPCSSSTDDVVMTKPAAYSGMDSSQDSPDSAQQPTSSTPFLPPCRVCGEKASGFHYGVNTCEACKVRLLYYFVIQLNRYVPGIPLIKILEAYQECCVMNLKEIHPFRP